MNPDELKRNKNRMDHHKKQPDGRHAPRPGVVMEKPKKFCRQRRYVDKYLQHVNAFSRKNKRYGIREFRFVQDCCSSFSDPSSQLMNCSAVLGERPL